MTRPIVQQGHFREISNTEALNVPNGASFPISPVLGDQYVLNTDGVLYVYNGTDWIPCGVYSRPSQGFQTSVITDNYKSTSTGVCPGANSFIVTALTVPFTGRDLAKAQFIAECVNGATGWRLFWAYGSLRADVFDGTGTVVTATVPVTAFDSRQHAGDMHVVTLRCRQVSSNTEVSLWVGSAQRAIQPSTNANVLPGTTANLYLGSGTFSGDEVAMDGGIYGFGYYAGTLTDDQLRTLTGRCAAQGTLPLDVITWTTAYLGSSFLGVPSTVSPIVGSGNLNKQGSPTESIAFFPPGGGGNNVITVTVSGGGGGSSTAGVSTVDFGASSVSTSHASVTITGQAAIGPSSSVKAWLLPVATADHSVDEHLVEPIRVLAHTITAGVGFEITAICDSGATYGEFSVAWEWQ